MYVDLAKVTGMFRSICLAMITSAHAWSLLGNNGSPDDIHVVPRKQFFSELFDVAARCASSSALVAGGIASAPTLVSAGAGAGDVGIAKVVGLENFPFRNDWTGSNLKLLSISDAASVATSSSAFEMGKWPDPILRRQASPIPSMMLGTDQLKVVGTALRKTALAEGAVGLAAQQCGVDGRILWIDTTSEVENLPMSRNKRRMRGEVRGDKSIARAGEGAIASKQRGQSTNREEEGLFLVNPRITWRSSEMEMLPWTETCLVLPPRFSATVLRDASISLEYETLDGETKSISLDGELARCVQHEMDHDRGILIVDHIDLGEMEGGERGTMAMLERENHPFLMATAYERYISESTL